MRMALAERTVPGAEAVRADVSKELGVAAKRNETYPPVRSKTDPTRAFEVNLAVYLNYTSLLPDPAVAVPFYCRRYATPSNFFDQERTVDIGVAFWDDECIRRGLQALLSSTGLNACKAI
jgi:hypothetical protein